MRQEEQFLICIVAPPPTPNGDLHVGHLSGPYFGADVLRRYLDLRGRATVSALSVDLNQSYVVTTAERLGLSPRALAERSYDEVRATLSAARIGFDVVGMPDAEYGGYVRDWFARLDAAGAFVRRRRAVPYDPRRGRFLFESYASGFCPVCLAKTNANICEACGHPNDARDLLGLHPTGGAPADPIELREVEELVLDLETLRPEIERHLAEVVPPTRPGLSRLCAELLAVRLPAFPVTFPSAWGVPAPFADADGLVLNVWAEMVPGHYWWLERAAAARGMPSPLAPEARAEYVQYLGFDNSFFYVFAHLGLALAARRAGLPALPPTAFVTNEFYLLENFKFSTSQGHLIWGRDLLAEADPEEVRFHLAWSNPENDQANFSRNDLEAVVSAKLRGPLAQAHALLGALPESAQDGESDGESDGEGDDDAYARLVLDRFASAYDHRRQSLRIAAQTVANGLVFLAALAGRQASPSSVRAVARALAVGLVPLMPEAGERLWRASGAEGAPAWPDRRDARG